MTHRLMRHFRSFVADQDGSMSIELLLVTPILLWALLSTFVYFDLFRTEANSHRAALTIADMFSREQTAVDTDYLDGGSRLLETLTFSDDTPDYRITVYRYQGGDDTYRVVWSQDRGMGGVLDDDDLVTFDNQGLLPLLASGDRAILVQTRVEYSAPFSIGLGVFTSTNLDDQTFTTFTVIRPRFQPSLCWDPEPENPANAPVC